MIQYRLQSEDQMPAIGREIRRLLREHQEKGLSVTVDVYRPPATNNQKVKLRLMLEEFAKETGDEDPERFIRQFLAEYGVTKVVRLNNTEATEKKTLSEYTNDDASVMIERVRTIAHEYGITLQEGG